MSGHIVDGLKAAANLIELQKPHLRGAFPEIDGCQTGVDTGLGRGAVSETGGAARRDQSAKSEVAK